MLKVPRLKLPVGQNLETLGDSLPTRPRTLTPVQLAALARLARLVEEHKGDVYAALWEAATGARGTLPHGKSPKEEDKA